MRLDVEKGRMFGVSWPWIHFILCNPDIMSKLNHTSLSVKYIAPKMFEGRIFGLRVDLQIVIDAKPDPEDEVHIISEVQMPLNLGQTHTVAHYRYSATSDTNTMVDFTFSIKTKGLFMAIYFQILKTRIDKYIKDIMMHNERAATLVQDAHPVLIELLDEEQLNRISEFRRSIPSIMFREEFIVQPMRSASEAIDDRIWHSELQELNKIYKRMEVKASYIEKELERIRDTRDGVATLLIARRLLEVLVTKICEESLKRSRGKEPLARLLDKIADKKLVPEYVMTSMKNLNQLSTYGAHPKEFSPRQVREALMALCSVMEWHIKGKNKENLLERDEGAAVS